MTALEQFNAYLRRVELRLRLFALSRGAAILAGSALALTLLFVWIGNNSEFAQQVFFPLRILLFVAIAIALSFALVLPLLKINRRHVARVAERRIRGFEERLLTLAERPNPANAFTELLAEDALRIAQEHKESEFANPILVRGSFISATIAAAVLVWMILGGPGYWGYGASLLWTGSARAGSRPLYDISVQPGNKTIRRKSNQIIRAELIGFSARNVILHAKYQNALKWDQAWMQSESKGSGYQFLFPGVSDQLEYYVQAGARQSKHYTISVKDLPGVKRVRVTVHFPSELQLKDVVEDPGGDIRAVQGSQAEISVLTDRPLNHGVLVLDNGSRIELARGEGNWTTARMRLEKDGSYHVAAIDGTETVRISDDYFIEAKKDEPPSVKIARPGRDPHVSPIEEVPVVVNAADDFGLQGLELHYSVNGGEEKTIPLLDKKGGVKEAEGKTTLYLENFKLVPGDIVSFYATARDASKTSRSDIVFAQAEPFDFKFRQVQQAGGQGMMGDNDRISERQKELIAATWNELKDEPKERRKVAEDARFLADLEGKLGEQAKALAQRMGNRELVDTSSEFQKFSEAMNEASQLMSAAVDKLRPAKWQDALSPEQKALQTLLRAEAMFRDIQVAFGNTGRSGMGGNGAGRDLERLFDLELDTSKNQYETGESASSENAQQKALDEALQRLEALAKRQQELAAQQPHQQPLEQRWQEEQLRREAEQLRQQMQNLARNGSPSQQSDSSQQGGQQSSSSSSAGSRQSAQFPNHGRAMQDQQTSETYRQAMDALARAEDEMRKAVSERDAGAKQRAAQQLAEAQNLLNSMQQRQQGDSLSDLTGQAQEIAKSQSQIANRMKQMYGGNPGGDQQNGETGVPGADNSMPQMDDPRFGFGYRRRYWQQLETEPSRPATQQEKALAAEKEKLAARLEQLQKQMQGQAENMASGQPETSSKLRKALSDAEQKELALRMRKNAEWLRDGFGSRTSGLEDSVTRGVEQLSRDLRDAQQSLSAGNRNGQNGQGDQFARASAELRGLREQLERGAQQGGQQARNAPGGPVGGGGPFIGDSGVQNAIQDLWALRQRVDRGDRQFRDDLDRALWSLRQLYGAQPGLLEQRISHEVLPNLGRLEAELNRRAVTPAENARTTTSEPAPEQYRDAVAEYFKKLSR